MKIVIVGASGYLGEEIATQADSLKHEVIGTYSKHKKHGLISFSLENESDWQKIKNTNPEIIIWAAKEYSPDVSSENFEDFINSVNVKKFIYISSDIVLCQRAFRSKSRLLGYAVQKKSEQETVLNIKNSLALIPGPIYGMNANGKLDTRTEKLKEDINQSLEFWDDVYKTFVNVGSLASTVLNNLDKTGLYHIGPPDRTSFYEFYISRARAIGLPTNNIKPNTITDKKLADLGQCRDISFTDKSNRLWND